MSHQRRKISCRLWAYLTMKQLLDRQVLLKGQEKEDEKKEALKLSLKYQFVTPLTSVVVTKPQEGDVEVANKPKEGDGYTADVDFDYYSVGLNDLVAVERQLWLTLSEIKEKDWVFLMDALIALINGCSGFSLNAL
ncbi:inter-alpha-trypsin inhibitor heavy chain H4-like [Carassius carassius]|uniref:inter-alpha-trypsin inhibitor heavy chain H4-like n=1 Tax=Carassius carassius TaxID=217509 RepID=UPI002868D604|nr:inter-alpha-trypsin inhibitor heavy chain H4-like [Carassius carassius]